ncbi:related to phosphoserine phosphatase [Cephalotrichum gorgonifer]|uniref:phosphoserine phosphatase n=1 Tax=Cephalotrichum gorgonifer TaxID=2041049 RepID=A0AAE8ST02_9PEZI|nr:related to phosphoserine phosphatase [Cephalotrichum gorgonifer]
MSTSPAKTPPPTSPSSAGGAPGTRPQLSATMRTSSFLREHQQYRPPKSSPENHYGIDTVVEDLRAPSSPGRRFVPYTGVPSSEENPPTIVEGLNHNLSHENCAPGPGRKTSRLVATLFYKKVDHSATTATTTSSSPPSLLAASAAADAAISELSTSMEQLPANLAPTTNIDNFPLEPPSGSCEQLDHLYGSYISPLCITAFLHLMSSFPLGQGDGELHSSHRCLDNPDQPRVVELTLSPAPSPAYLSLSDLRKHESIYRFEKEWNVEVVLQKESLWRRHPRLVVFDMDSTLITQEVIDLLAATVTDPPDLADRVADITHRAMLGELEFEGAFRERVKLLTGVSGDIFEKLRPVLDVTKGVPALVKALRRLGVKTAVLSGGFQPLTSWLAGELGLNYAHANEVVIDEATGALTGEVKGIIVGKERKRELLLEIAAKEGIDTSQVIAVGDGANDLRMMEAAGLGVAWNAKPVVQMEASARLNSDSLLDLLYLFGFTQEEIEALTE